MFSFLKILLILRILIQKFNTISINYFNLLIFRTLQAFQQWQKKGSKWTSTDYIVPSEMCAMINVVLEAKNQVYIAYLIYLNCLF